MDNGSKLKTISIVYAIYGIICGIVFILLIFEGNKIFNEKITDSEKEKDLNIKKIIYGFSIIIFILFVSFVLVYKWFNTNICGNEVSASKKPLFYIKFFLFVLLAIVTTLLFNFSQNDLMNTLLTMILVCFNILFYLFCVYLLNSKMMC